MDRSKFYYSLQKDTRCSKRKVKQKKTVSRVNVPPNRSAKAARQKYKDKLWDIKHNDKHIQHFFLN